MSRSTAIWFGAAGVLSLFTWVIFTFGDPVYYDATTLTDYAAVVGLTMSFSVTGIALILLWRDPPVKRGSGCSHCSISAAVEWPIPALRRTGRHARLRGRDVGCFVDSVRTLDRV